MTSGAAAPVGRGAFARLGRWVVRHPAVPIVFWVVLLAVAIPALGHLGGVTTNSSQTLPASAPSSIAEARLAQLFPNSTGGASAVLLFYGPNVVGRSGQALLENVTTALRGDRTLTEIASIESVYTQYAAYLTGEVELANAAIVAAETAPTPLTTAVNATATVLWGPPALYLAHWEPLAANNSSNRSVANYPAYQATRSALSNSTEELSVLSAFYNGYASSGTGFNGTAACAAAPNTSALLACADRAASTNERPLVPVLFGASASEENVANATLGDLGVGNYTAGAAQRTEAELVIGAETGFPATWVDLVWTAFPSGTVSVAAASAFANATVVAATLASEPLPVPVGLRAQFVNSAGSASLVDVSFLVADDATNASGGDPVYSDLTEIGTVVPPVVRASDPTGTISFALTGPAPLDALTQEAVSSSLALVLPLTVGLLLAISMLYFRSPVTPLVTFAGLGIALILGLGATVLVGTLITHVDTTALTLEEVFVLGVGTDYSIFLVARYREELVHGRSSEEAIVASVTWAGQSIATSGTTAIIVTVALAFSGVALLAQWGMVLSLAILITMALSLTLVPAFLRILGPRIFWPMTRDRFRRSADRATARTQREATYFYRAARATEKRPKAFVGALVAVSVPLVAIALALPLSYDFYAQLPSGHPATDGLAELGRLFGPGFAVPSFALVTFATPFLSGNVTNATDFVDVGELTLLAETTPGIAAVDSPVGPSGANLSEWLGLASLPTALRSNLLGLLVNFVGADGRTVLLTFQPSETGLSTGAVAAIDGVRSAFDAYQASAPEIRSVAFGGGAPVISDLAAETNVATEVMLGAVTVGLVAVLLAVLRSWIIAVMAVATIGLSISWAWAVTDLVFRDLLGFPVFFYVRTILFMLVLGLGIDYNIFLLTRVREERLRRRSAGSAVVEAVGRTGGIITAAALILASAFAALVAGEFTLIRAIGFSVAVAVLLDAMVVRTYLVPSALHLLGERAWTLSGRRPGASTTATSSSPPDPPGG